MGAPEDMNVAVIGAGIGGLAAAIALQREGFSVDVYEQATMLKEVGAALIIHPESMEILDGWGLSEGYRKYSTHVTGINILKGATGKLVKSTVTKRQTGNLDSVHRVDIHNHLRAQIPAENLHLSRKCKHIEEHADHVEVTFTDGSMARASIVIAADGIHSQIRPWLNKEKDTAIFSGMQGHRSVLPRELVEDLVPHNIPCIWIKGTKSFFVLLPVQNGAGVAFDALLPVPQASEESWTSTISQEELIGRLEAFDPIVHEIVRRTKDPIGVNSLYDREPITRWHTKRVTLLGDAAHPMLPFEGQGANQAIQDAAALGQCLRRVKASGIEAALEKYSRIRIPATRKVQQKSRVRLYHPVRYMLMEIFSHFFTQLKGGVAMPTRKETAISTS